MKKNIKKILSLAVLAVIIGPVMVGAQTAAGECCRASSSITLNDYTVASSGGGTCAEVDTFTLPTDTVIGHGDCDGGTPSTCNLKGETVTMDYESQEWGTACLINAITNVTNWIFYFFLVIAVLIAVIAGFQFMTASGDPAKIASARGLLTYMVIGLVIAALSKVIPTLVRSVVGF